ncbi:hypothetical protein HYV73_01500 [Candidatus Uhrbacteria bacterium]|nr:hypothetical protein [Candidatus Uhrbacteria bacterium]
MPGAGAMAFQIPASETVASSNGGMRLFTMPVAYRHGAEVKLVEPAAKTSVPVPHPSPKPLAPPVPPAPLALSRKGSSKKMIFVVFLFLFLVAGGIAAFFLIPKWLAPEPAPIVQPKPPVVPPIVEPPKPPEVKPPVSAVKTPGIDSDSDGLTDVEENNIYKTDPRLPDTDKDGFLDGNEVFHRYNPNGTAPATLLQTGLVKSVDLVPFGKGGIRLLYPAIWTKVDGKSEKEPLLKFVVPSAESVSVNTGGVQDDIVSLRKWHDEQFPQEKIFETKTKNGYPMLMSEDQLKAWVVIGNSSYSLVYDGDGKSTIDYLQTFQMMINSIEIIP